MQKLIAKSKNGVGVTYDPIHSHAATHLEDTKGLKKLVIEVIGSLDLNGQKIAQHFDLGRIVGSCDLVNITDADEVVFGVRKNREHDGLVPFVKNRQGDPCPYVALHLFPQSDKSYALSSAWIGTFGDDDEPFPQSPESNDRSIDFWNKHAFVYGSQEIMSNTETSTKPW
jgi:hypothetical protein